MTPQIRELYSQAEEKNTAATELLKSGKAEDLTRAETLFDEAEALQQRAKAYERAESIKNAGVEGLREQDAQEREDLRERAEVAADATRSRGTEQTTDGTLESEAREARPTDEEMGAYAEHMRLFGDFIEELRKRRSPDAEARRNAFRQCLAHGYQELTREERRHIRVMSRLEVSSRDQKGASEERAMGLGSAASLAILVPPEVQEEVRLATLAFGGWRSTRAMFMQTSTGRTIPIPTIDDTSNQGSRRGEHEALANAADVAAEPNALGAYLVRSGVFKLGYELVQDESFGLDSMIVSLGTIRNERRQQTDWTTGDGQYKPKGVMEGITSGKTAANTASFVPTDWFDLFESVDSSYHSLAEVMLSNNALTKLKVMEGGIGQGLWQPGLAAGQPAQIDGHPYVVNFAMDSVATGNKPAIFGDLSWMYIREVVPTVVIRYTEKYAPDIGLEVVGRDDARLVNPGVVPVKCLTMA